MLSAHSVCVKTDEKWFGLRFESFKYSTKNIYIYVVMDHGSNQYLHISYKTEEASAAATIVTTAMPNGTEII